MPYVPNCSLWSPYWSLKYFYSPAFTFHECVYSWLDCFVIICTFPHLCKTTWTSKNSHCSLILYISEKTYFLHIFNVGTCVSRLHQPSFERKEFWRENLQRLKDWRGGFGWRQVANGGFGRGAPSRPIINHTATEPNYMIKPLQLPIHNMPLSPLQGGLFLNMTTPKTDHITYGGHLKQILILDFKAWIGGTLWGHVK